jgi:hypothetical protein
MTRSAITPINLAVVCGTVHGEPTVRDLPSGTCVVQFDVATTVVDGPAARTVSVPVAWADPVDATFVREGAEVVVSGTVRRRFFRVAGATQSRTEVVADAVIPARRRARVRAALDVLADRLAAG